MRNAAIILFLFTCCQLSAPHKKNTRQISRQNQERKNISQTGSQKSMHRQKCVYWMKDKEETTWHYKKYDILYYANETAHGELSLLNWASKVIHSYRACHKWQCDFTCHHMVVVDTSHESTLLDLCCVSSLRTGHAAVMELRSTDIKVSHSSLDWWVSTVQSTSVHLIFSHHRCTSHISCTRKWELGFGFTRQPHFKFHPSLNENHLRQLICVSLDPLSNKVLLVDSLSICNSFKSVSKLLIQSDSWSLF